MINQFDMVLNQKFSSEYLKASKKQKSAILSEYCALTGVSRNLAAKRLSFCGKNIYPIALKLHKKKKSGGPKKIFLKQHQNLIKIIWKLSGKICSERIYPLLKVYVKHLKDHILLNEFDQKTVDDCLNISLATLKRIIGGFPKIKGSTHHSNPSIYKSIPVDMYFGKNTKKPGYTEIDYVEHNGGNSSGRYCITGCYVDLFSGWLVRSASLGMSFKSVETIHDLNLKKIYHELTHYHSDNAKTVLKLLFQKVVNDPNTKNTENELNRATRSRPYQKEDNGHVEQKNGDKVRKLVGKIRYDNQEQENILNRLYEVEDKITNFFTPSQKLKKKTYVNGKPKKIYDKAKTPYDRLIRSKYVGMEVKTELRSIYVKLDLVDLRKKSDSLKKELITSISRKRDMS